jgi:hypothetical protein
MIVYVLARAYSDKSGFMICGVTEKKEIVQAFITGGSGVDPVPVIYMIDTEGDLLPEGHPGMVGGF